MWFNADYETAIAGHIAKIFKLQDSETKTNDKKLYQKLKLEHLSKAKVSNLAIEIFKISVKKL